MIWASVLIVVNMQSFKRTKFQRLNLNCSISTDSCFYDRLQLLLTFVKKYKWYRCRLSNNCEWYTVKYQYSAKTQLCAIQ